MLGSGRALRAALLAGALVVLLACLAPAAPGAGPPQRRSPGSARRPPHQQLSLVLPLRADVAGLERLATAVSTVGSPATASTSRSPALARRFGASRADRARVLRYLRRAGASAVKIDRTGLFADATMTVTLGPAPVRHRAGPLQAGRVTRFVAPTGAARVPAALAGAVTGVVGLDTRPLFGTPAPRWPRTSHFAHAPAQVRADNTFSGLPAALRDPGRVRGGARRSAASRPTST